MKNDSKHTNTDSFNKQIKQKLDNHSMPVDAELWTRIESELQEPKRKHLPLWLWVSMGSAAIITLLFVTHTAINFQNNSNMQQAVANKLPKEPNMLVMDNSIVVCKPVQDQKQASNNTNNQIIETFTMQSRSKEKNTKLEADTISTNRTNTATNSNKEFAVSQSDTTKSVRKKYELQLLEKPLATKTPEKKSIKKQNKSRWMIAALFSSGNSSMQSNHVSVNKTETTNNYSTFDVHNLPMDVTETTVTTSTPTMVKTSTSILSKTYTPTITGDGDPTTTVYTTSTNETIVTYKSINTTEPDLNLFSDINYHIPLSTGIKIGKSLSKKLSIESGLIYTYLQTDFAGDNIDASYQMHYLGIPLNLRYTVWNIRNFKLNLSAGMMAEKGLQSTYQLNQFKTSGTVSNTTTESISGIQWSAKTATELSYSFFSNYSLYCEPQLFYYFDNNQPISIRTKNPFVFGLQLGLRYDF